jgi:diguanylate cyclase (GGDEF)-like protein
MKERRTNHLTRKFVEEMSQKARKRRGPFVSHVTGLPSLRAFREGRASSFVAMTDLDNLKALNDRFGYAAGDALLRRFADVLTSVGLDSYHYLGGSLLCKGESYQELNDKLSQAQQILRQQPFQVYEDGRATTLESADFCFGIGTTQDEAQISLGRQKVLRVPEKAKQAGQKV